MVVEVAYSRWQVFNNWTCGFSLALHWRFSVISELCFLVSPLPFLIKDLPVVCMGINLINGSEVCVDRDIFACSASLLLPNTTGEI